MSEYDGDIKLSMSLDPKDVKEASKTLQDDIKQIFNQSAGKELDTKFKKLEASMSKTASKAQQLQEKLNQLENTKIPTTEYQEIQKQINDASIALAKLRERQDKFLETGGKTKSTTFKKMQYDAAQLENTIEYAKGELQDLVDTGKAFTLGSDTAQYGQTIQQLAEVNNQMRILTTQTEQASNTTTRMQKVMKGLSNIFKGFIGICKQVVSSLSNIIKKLFSLIGSGIKNGLKSLSNAIKGVGTSSNSADKSMKKMFWNLMKYGLGIRSLYVLFRRLRSAITEGVNNLVQTNRGMNATNDAISSVMSSLNALKNAWGAAFAPIIQIVAPILSRFIDMLTQFANRIAMFTSGLMGKTTAIVAKKTPANYAESLDSSGKASGKSQEEKYNKAVQKAQDKYNEQVEKTAQKNADAMAKAEEKQAKAAEKLAKKQEKANQQLGAYDKLNVIAKDDAEELDDIQAKTYEEPELELPNLEDYMTGMTDFDSMFEEVPIESAIKDLIDRIKEAWESGDFRELGNLVGEKLKEKLDEVTQWLQEVAQPFAAKLGTAISTFINGLVEVDGLAASLGQTLGEVLNTCADFMTNIVDNLDFEGIGQFIADGIMSFIDTVDFAQMGHNFAQWYNGLFDALKGFTENWDPDEFAKAVGDFVNTAINDFQWEENGKTLGEFAKKLLDTISKSIKAVDWNKLGTDIADMIQGVDWGGVATSLFDALGAALGGLGAFLVGLIDDAMNELVEWWYDVAYEDGKFTIEGLLEGIVQALKDIGSWIKKNIFDPFIKGFQEAFKINSPSKVMEDEGGLLMDGLKQGAKNKIESIKKIFNDLKNQIVSVFNSLKTTVISIWNNMWSGIKGVINSILNGVQRMANGVISGFNRMISAINNLSLDIPDWVPEIGGRKLGFHIPTMATVSIPRLAQGAVIPPNKEFLAMLGDQSTGTNIEAPLNTIMEALNKVLDARDEISNHEPIVLQLDGKTVAEVVWDEEEKRYKQRGSSFSPMFT